MKLIDFMPPRAINADLVRLVVGEGGSVPMRLQLAVRFGYGARVPWVHRQEDGTLRIIAGADQLVLRTTAPVKVANSCIEGDFVVEAGESVAFALTYAPSHLPPPDPCDAQQAFGETKKFWEGWSAKAHIDPGERRHAMLRSLVTLKALTYGPDRRHRRRPHHQPARNPGRHPQLGLPLLLAARRHALAAGAAGRRLFRGGGGVA